MFNMKKITYIQEKVIEVKEIQEGINPDFGHSYLEIEKRNTIGTEIDKTVFFVENLPNCELKYIRLENGLFVEANELTKLDIDIRNEYNQNAVNLNWKYLDRPIRITIPTYLCINNEDYANAANEFKLLQKPYEILGNDESFRVYLKELNMNSGFILTTGVISSIDARLLIEQLDTFFIETNGVIQHI